MHKNNINLIRRFRLAALGIVAALLLGACGGGGGSGASTSSPSGFGSSSTSSASSTSSSAASSSSASTPASSSSSSTSSASSSRISLYVTDPVVANCDTGQLKDSERTAVLDKLNEIRARHGLPAVTYNATDNSAAAQAALYMVANATLTTTPSVGGHCYTSDAARLAGSSDLVLGAPLSLGGNTQDIPSTQMIVSFLINAGPGTLGQRRLLLNPFLGSTTFGRVDGLSIDSSTPLVAGVLKVIGNDVADVSAMTNDFVAYPYGIYPNAEFSKTGYLSFSAIANKTDASANGAAQVSFSAATITVSTGGTFLSATNAAADYSGEGLPNSLQWKVSGLQSNVAYTVQISNVIVNGVTRQYTYSFTLQ